MKTKNQVTIAPSILSADLLNLEREIREIESCGATWHHIDVMDGHFVPNLTFGLPLIRKLKKISKLPLDVHIMISNPDQVALDYVEAGADLLTFHVEAATHHHRLAQAIRKKGAKAGVALNPGTPVSQVIPLLGVVDLVLLMSVNPGFSGQDFIANTPARLAELVTALQQSGHTDDVIIQVDGGVSDKNIRLLYDAGARAFVFGSFIYDATDRSAQIQKLRSVLP